jgi:hypothetical protein
MTYAEAEERAARLWADVIHVARVRVTPELWEVIVDTVHGRRVPPRHFMDATGVPTCHPDCIAREAKLGEVADA